MMKFIFYFLMLVPVIFIGDYWMIQWLIFMLTFIFMVGNSLFKVFGNISGIWGVDLLSYCLVILLLWILSLMILASYKIYKSMFYFRVFAFMVLILGMSLFMAFSSMNMFLFYLFFEVSLLPTLFLILGWGYQPERIEAGMYLLFYTLVFSLPMMLMLFYLYKNKGNLSFIGDFSLDSILMYLCMNMAFFVKMPMFMLHLWLPKAHVEAPISGSMILAGIMLKLGGYGLIRVMKWFSSLWGLLNLLFMMISIMGALIVSVLCIRQSDIKSLIAYSSVSHMGLVIGGIMTTSIWGFWGSLVLMVGHGLCSSGLFCLANINYERFNSRSMYLNKGLINLIPSMVLWWFMFTACNMAFPPSLNLFGEFTLIASLISYNVLMMVVLAFLLFLSAVYSLYLYSYIQHGNFYSGIFSVSMSFIREHLLLILHWVPLNGLILKSDLVFMWS